MGNRVIKFRAWDTSDNEMHEDGEAKYWLSQGFDSPNHDEIHFMQFTGLQDKNGKDIYEGDIVQYVWSNDFEDDADVVENLPVFFEDGIFRTQDAYLSEENDGISVIGNVYENPDLLNTSPEVIGEHITEPFEPTTKLTGITQYNQYKNNGGSMSFTEWYRDGRYDPNLEPDTNNFGDNDFATPEHLKIV